MSADQAVRRIRLTLSGHPVPAVLISYVMAGFPRVDDTVPMLLAAEAAGVKMVELGLPYSDPLADGPVVQSAGQRALGNGMTVARALAQVQEAREGGLAIPLVVMTYLNPLLRMGLRHFCELAARSGVDGILVPDLPLEEMAELAGLAEDHGIAMNTMVAPTTPSSRIARAGGLSTGFIYCVSRTGVTGAAASARDEGTSLLQRARQNTDAPLVLGFGVRSAEQVRAVTGLADGVVVASLLLEEAAAAADPVEAVARKIRELRA